MSISSRYSDVEAAVMKLGIPVMAHRLKHSVIELDWPGYEQGWVLWLVRHIGRGSIEVP